MILISFINFLRILISQLAHFNTFISNFSKNELLEVDTSCVETCRSSLFVIPAIIVTDIYVHSLVELKILEENRLIFESDAGKLHFKALNVRFILTYKVIHVFL